MADEIRSSGFQPIGAHISRWQDLIEQIREQERIRRAEIIASRGWPDDVRCLECGDAGTVSRPVYGPDGQERMSTTICRCDAGKAIEQAEERERRWDVMLPVRLRNYRLETSPQQGAAEDLRGWLNEGPWEAGSNALIYGPIGTGKTGLAIGAMRLAYDQGASVGLVMVSDWLIQQRPNGSDDPQDDPMERAARPQLLVIDDLGTQKNSEWVHERLYVLINRRYLDNKATILTTNHSDLTLLRESLGDRATSRLMEHVQLVGVGGEDLRKRPAWAIVQRAD